jgi:hypothetical protein
LLCPFLKVFAAEGVIAKGVREGLGVWGDLFEANGAGCFAVCARAGAGSTFEEFWHFEGDWERCRSWDEIDIVLNAA